MLEILVDWFNELNSHKKIRLINKIGAYEVFTEDELKILENNWNERNENKTLAQAIIDGKYLDFDSCEYVVYDHENCTISSIDRCCHWYDEKRVFTALFANYEKLAGVKEFTNIYNTITEMHKDKIELKVDPAVDYNSKILSDKILHWLESLTEKDLTPILNKYMYCIVKPIREAKNFMTSIAKEVLIKSICAGEALDLNNDHGYIIFDDEKHILFTVEDISCGYWWDKKALCTGICTDYTEYKSIMNKQLYKELGTMRNLDVTIDKINNAEKYKRMLLSKIKITIM